MRLIILLLLTVAIGIVVSMIYRSSFMIEGFSAAQKVPELYNKFLRAHEKILAADSNKKMSKTQTEKTKRTIYTSQIRPIIVLFNRPEYKKAILANSQKYIAGPLDVKHNIIYYKLYENPTAPPPKAAGPSSF